MKYYKYNKRIYRYDGHRYWVYDKDASKRKFGRWGRKYDGNWTECMIHESEELKHHLERKRACEKSEAQAFIELL